MSKKKLKKKLRKLEEENDVLQVKYNAQKSYADDLEKDMRRVVYESTLPFEIVSKWMMRFKIKDDFEKMFWNGQR